MMRKLALVGLVVLVGRGSVAQIAAGSVLSFGFLALHIKFWPLKCVEDNVLRTCAEVHVFLTIVMAFIMKMPKEIMQSEKVQTPFYDVVLVTSLIVCLPLCTVVALLSKLRRAQRRGVLRGGSGPKAAFGRYKLGLASSDDRRVLREYFESVGCGIVHDEETSHTTNRKPAAAERLLAAGGWALGSAAAAELDHDGARVSLRSTWSGIPSMLGGAATPDSRDSTSSMIGFEMTALSDAKNITHSDEASRQMVKTNDSDK
jgi:hypothetical protein